MGLFKKSPKVPENGINESSYIDVNGSKQWIAIYGQDLSNPVILYLHGGPGMSTSAFSHVITRKWADRYTVAIWDQRNCGKSYCQDMGSIELSNELVMKDAMAVTDYLREHLHKDKIILLGHSWGSMLGARMVLENPERFEKFIGTGQLIDLNDDESLMVDELKQRVKSNNEDSRLVEEMMSVDKTSKRYFEIREKLLDKYDINLNIKKSDVNITKAVLGNPYYSSSDLRNNSKYLKDYESNEKNAYRLFIVSKTTNDYFSLKDVTEFPIPYYNINGDNDHIADFDLAQRFFDRLNAPKKKMYVLKGASHGTLIERSDEFSVYLHEIAEE